MADLANPVDEGLIDLTSVRRRIVAAFNGDGRLDEVECQTLAAFDAAVAGIREYRARERMVTYWLKRGDLDSRYGAQLAADAGATIVRLEMPMQQTARVVRLDDRRSGPQDAA